MKRIYTIVLLWVLVAAGGRVSAQDVPSDLLALDRARLQTLLASKSVSLVTSSYTVTNPTTGAVIATVTIGTGETGYLLGYRAGGTVQGRLDVYSGSTSKYRSAFFGDYSETGWIWCPEWSLLTAAAASTLSVRAPAAMTGTYSATIVVGKVR